LLEKQKAKYTYGVLERQFANLFAKAAAKQGVTGENFLKLLEARLDNIVYRLGIAPTRSSARQLVSHKHITVNGQVVNIPSYSIRPGDVIAVRERSQSLEAIVTSVAGRKINKFSWLDWDADKLQGTFVNFPERADIPENIKENLIVELYSK
jgi:small subunit ribosomal protein S4